MNTRQKLTILVLLTCLAMFGGRSLAQNFSAGELARRRMESRAFEAVIWGMPAVNFDLMHQALIRDAKAGSGSNKIVHWSKLSDRKNQTLTPNPDAVYFMPLFDAKDAGRFRKAKVVAHQIHDKSEPTMKMKLTDVALITGAAVLTTTSAHAADANHGRKRTDLLSTIKLRT
jgi:hypothetical protein